MTMASDPELLTEVRRRFQKILNRYPLPDTEDSHQKPQWDRYLSHAKPAIIDNKKDK